MVFMLDFLEILKLILFFYICEFFFIFIVNILLFNEYFRILEFMLVFFNLFLLKL